MKQCRRKQLWCVTVTKEYCAAGEQPGVEVQLTWHEAVSAEVGART